MEPGCERPGPTIHVRGLLLLKIIDILEVGIQRFLQNPASNLLPFRLRHREEGQRGEAAPFWDHWVSCFPWRPPTYALPPGRIICPARHLSSPPESQLAGGGEIGAAHRGMPPPVPPLTCVPPPASLSRTASPKLLPLGGCAMNAGRVLQWVFTCMRQLTPSQSKPWGRFADETVKAQGEIKWLSQDSQEGNRTGGQSRSWSPGPRDLVSSKALTTVLDTEVARREVWKEKDNLGELGC